VTSNAIFAFWDFLPTVAELAGVPESEVAFSDGTSAASVLRGILCLGLDLTIRKLSSLPPGTCRGVLYLVPMLIGC